MQLLKIRAQQFTITGHAMNHVNGERPMHSLRGQVLESKRRGVLNLLEIALKDRLVTRNL